MLNIQAEKTREESLFFNDFRSPTHGPLDFDKVMENIKNFCALKEKTAQKKPFVELQFILTKLNQKEVESARAFAFGGFCFVF